MSDDGPPGHAGYQPLDLSRAAVPARPLCAASVLDELTVRRHRVGPLPIEICIGPRRFLLCGPGCLQLLASVWRARQQAMQGA